MICILTQPATATEIHRMSRIFGDYIKLAVDVERRILAGGSESQAECEAALLIINSSQQNIWGAGINLITQSIEYESIINIRPSQGNRSMIVQSAIIQSQISQIVTLLIGDNYAGN